MRHWWLVPIGASCCAGIFSRRCPASIRHTSTIYLAGADGERRRFQLAQHLAGVFTQYLIYRPEWILAWERGEKGDWQAALWRKVQSAIGLPHRAQRRETIAWCVDCTRRRRTAAVACFRRQSSASRYPRDCTVRSRCGAVYIYTFPIRAANTGFICVTIAHC